MIRCNALFSHVAASLYRQQRGNGAFHVSLKKNEKKSLASEDVLRRAMLCKQFLLMYF